MKTHTPSTGLLALLMLMTGCTGQALNPAPEVAAVAHCGGAGLFAEGGERATLWVRNSSEYRASAEGIYQNATAALARAIADPAWSAEPKQTDDFTALPPAVVMDIDETVLDNSPAQARMILEQTCPADFPAVWDAWLAERAAKSVPGAADFVRAARGMRDAGGRPVRVFLITNRECVARAGSETPCPQQEDTAENLRALGLDAPSLAEDLMLKGEEPGWGSEKEARRLAVAQNYRILLNVGDDLADFLPRIRRGLPSQRERARCAYQDWWGERWFLIPNPMYGSWEQILGPDLEAELKAPPDVREDCRSD